MPRLFHRKRKETLLVSVPEEIDDRLQKIADERFDGSMDDFWRDVVKWILLFDKIEENGGEIQAKKDPNSPVETIR